ncbi:hypothetical protein [Duganella sp. Root198D2]|uniref:DUF6928 family protein n=1 Tax=Duganella sp. Root198D2 TaxID=1736489 RepID=UPI00070AA50E|nr:hypothetical protein [Duganella sp. Root198D2]KRB87190.1 hypothetical protein ASE26_07290 [Duganella sp. Root198D2]
MYADGDPIDRLRSRLKLDREASAALVSRLVEAPFWSGERPVGDPGDNSSNYPLSFHPLEMGEAALENLFGYQLEGNLDSESLDPDSVPLMAFTAVKKPWWKRLA